MIKVELRFNIKPIEAMQALTENIDEINASIVKELKDEYEQAILDELMHVPPSRSYPADYPNGTFGGRLEWTSAKQRRYYWAVIARFDSQGNHIPFKRTGKLERSWEVAIEAGKERATLIVRNKAGYAKHVLGSFTKNKSRARKYQQRFHKVTGWPVAVETIDYFEQAIVDMYDQKFDEFLSRVSTGEYARRAVTNGKSIS